MRDGLQFVTCVDQFREKVHIGNIECPHELDNAWHSLVLLSEGTFLSFPTMNKNISIIALLYKMLAVDIS